MPPKRRGSGPRTRAVVPSTVEVEQSIDAVDWLRKHMRSLGMLDCAEALDEAFARCLKAYLELQDQAATDPTAKPRYRPKPKIN